MASLDSDGAPKADAGSQLSASRRDSEMASKLQNAKSFTIRVLQEITDDFSEERKIGQGTYGKVYLAKLENGEDIAVKVLHNNMPGIDDVKFQCEFENLMRLEHHNIVKLVAYCYQTQHKPMQYMGRTIFAERIYRALCFEYMQNGSLQKHLSDECTGLDWHTRYKIIKGTCEGLKHLHQGFQEPIYHLDLKPDNILLDNNMSPKLADFGMSRMLDGLQTIITESPIGTFGYLPMEYLHGNIVSSKLDIFSLGVVMIKIIGGPEAYSKSVDMHHEEFLDLVHSNWRNRMLKTHHAYRPLEAYCKQVNICTEIALTCMEIDRHKRPNIEDIIHQLNDTEAMIGKAGSSRMNGDLVKLIAIPGSEGITDAETRSEFPVLVQVTAPPWCHVEEMPRAGVDIVVVLDQEAWINDRRITKIIINKLSSNDRLSFVLTGNKQRRLLELTFMDNQGLADALDVLNSNPSFDQYYVNIAAGLQLGAEILKGREPEESERRVGCIVFVSVVRREIITYPQICPEFPVHIFGRCYQNPDAEGMKYIADKTCGTFSYCLNLRNLIDAMEQFMAGILKVAATSIKLTIAAHEGVTISSIESGSYVNKTNSDKLSGEIDMHDIYAGEQKNFIVYLTVAADGPKKLVTIGGRYRSLNTTSKQLPDTNVFVVRPQSGRSPGKLAMHHVVAAELARIRLVKGLSALVEADEPLTLLQMKNLRDSVRLSKDGEGAPKETLSRLLRYVDEMSKAVHHEYVYPKQVPYLMAWLSCISGSVQPPKAHSMSPVLSP